LLFVISIDRERLSSIPYYGLILKFKELSLDNPGLLLKLKLLRLGLSKEELNLSSLFVVFIIEKSLRFIDNFIFGTLIFFFEL
jgi:hypothetical protein